jgi:HSP20 family protein
MSALMRTDRFDDLFPEVFRRLARPLRLADEAPGEIRLDVSENDQAYEVRAEIPGVKKEDIQIHVDGNYVSISGEVRKEREEKSGERLLVKETYVGNVSRGFSLAHEIDGEGVVAKLEEGILKLTLPKRASDGKRMIKVQ